MKKRKAVVLIIGCLVAVGLLGNALGASARMTPGEANPQTTGQGGWLAQISPPWFSALRLRPDGLDRSSALRSLGELPDEAPQPTNTPAAPLAGRTDGLQRLPSGGRQPQGAEAASGTAPVAEQLGELGVGAQRSPLEVDLAGEAAVGFQVTGSRAPSPLGRQSPSIATMKVQPGQITVGDEPEYTAEVIGAGLSDLGGFEFQMHFDPALVSVDAIELGSFFDGSGRDWYPLGPYVDEEAGVARFGAFSVGEAAGPGGSGQLTVVSLLPEPGATGETTVLNLTNIQATNTGGTALPITAAGQEVCVDVLSNPQMNVLEHGDGTATVYDWTILARNIYYSDADYASPPYSLAMIDEDDGSDPDLIYYEGDYWDLDMFGQGFEAPTGLTYMKVSYSRLYADANGVDNVWSQIWTLTNDGLLDDLIVSVDVGESPAGWSNRYWELTEADHSSTLDTLSGRPLALVLRMVTDRASPYEWIWLDDTQLHLCYTRGPSAVYLPFIIRQPPVDPGPTCLPREPDSVSQRGSLDVGAVCAGSLAAADQMDYYSLRLNGASSVRLRLFSVPGHANWGGGIYEDTTGYPVQCFIGDPTPGIDKYVDCTLNPSKSYLVLVDRGGNPTGGAYSMSVTER